MSLMDKILYLFQVKKELKEAIEEKGVEVPSNTTFEEYASKIDEIPLGIVDEEKDLLRRFISRKLGDFKVPEDVGTLRRNCFSGVTECNSLDFSNSVLYNTSFDGSIAPDPLDLTKVAIKENSYICEGYKGKKVILPETTTKIYKTQFRNCSNLKEINTDNITSIGYGGFEGCKSLESLKLENVTELGTYESTFDEVWGSCFRNCTMLNNVSLPNVTSITSNCFSGCSNLQSINMPKTTKLGKYTFESTGFVSIDLSNITSLDLGTFRNCKKLTSFNLSSELKSLPEYCFANCTGVTSIDLKNVETLDCTALPPNITSLDLVNIKTLTCDSSYYAMNIKKLYIPSTLSISSLNAPNLSYLNNDCILFTDATSKPDIWQQKWLDNFISNKLAKATIKYGSNHQEYLNYKV